MIDNNSLLAFASYSKSNNVREKSSSGGLFYELAYHVIKGGGIVYGVAMRNDNRSAKYSRITSHANLRELMGSKYIQAQVGNTFVQVKKDLEQGICVLFSGTGCVINGLKGYLKTDYENLVCLDVICHGVSSPMIWSKYIDYKERKYNTLISEVYFRWKRERWEEFGIMLVTKEGKSIYSPAGIDPYMLMFLNNYSLRPSCYECIAKECKHSDITLGDFWGIDRVLPGINDKKGISVVLVRSERGKKLLDSIKNRIVLIEVSYDDAVKGNPTEYSSVLMPPQREVMFKNAKDKDFIHLLVKSRRIMLLQLLGIIRLLKKRTFNLIRSNNRHIKRDIYYNDYK